MLKFKNVEKYSGFVVNFTQEQISRITKSMDFIQTNSTVEEVTLRGDFDVKVYNTDGTVNKKVFLLSIDVFATTVIFRFCTSDSKEVFTSVRLKALELFKTVITYRSMAEVISGILSHVWGHLEDNVCKEVADGKQSIDWTLYPEAHALGLFLTQNRTLLEHITCRVDFAPDSTRTLRVDLGELNNGFKCSK